MSVFNHPDFDGHEHVSFFHDAESGLRAVIAIHTTQPYGLSGGGCRMWKYESDEEAMRDVLRLSRAMSFKLALSDLPSGGAKCALIGDPQRDKSEALFRALGRCVDRLGGKFILSEDVGTNEEDMRHVAKETRYVVGTQTNTGPATAYGTFLGLRAAARYGLDRNDLTGVRVAVQGVGNVGERLCKHLVEAGAKVVAVTDVDAERARRVAREVGAEVVAPDAIYDQQVDILAPCALGAIFDERTIPRLRCRLVAGAANNQLADENRHGEMIAKRGIVFAPDFVLNAGGVIGASQEGFAIGDRDEWKGPVYDEARAFRECERITDLVKTAFERSRTESVTPYVAAVRMAKEALRARRAR